jgi:Arc-like DNA binding domain
MAQINEQSDYQKTALRIPKELHTKIIEAAKANNRTMNAEIIDRLEKSLSSQPIDKVYMTTQQIKDIIKIVSDIQMRIDKMEKNEP